MKKEIKISKKLKKGLEKTIIANLHYMAFTKLSENYTENYLGTLSNFYRQLGKEKQDDFMWELFLSSSDKFKLYEEKSLTEKEKEEIREHNGKIKANMANKIIKDIFDYIQDKKKHEDYISNQK